MEELIAQYNKLVEELKILQQKEKLIKLEIMKIKKKINGKI